MKRKTALFSSVLVLLLALSVVPAFAGPPDRRGPPGPSIVELAIAANGPGGAYEGVFDTLIAALLAADESVLNTLSGPGQFTVFAPTDDAFEKLLAELGLTAADLLADKELVTDVLLYHVARGRRDSGSVLG